MKKILILMFVVTSFVVLHADSIDRKQIANDFLNLIAANEFTEVTEYYDDVMKKQFPPVKVKQFWNQIIQQYGKPLNFGLPTEREISGYNAVYIPIYFESITLEARVVFNKDDLISGFFITPVNYKDIYSKPEYVDTTKFHEDNYTFGSDYWKIAGTLTVPDDVENPPLVILVHGSGSHNRDEAIGPNKPFKDLAWGLASQGIAVFRYDKRNFLYPEKFMENLDTLTMYSESIEDPILAAQKINNDQNFKFLDIYLLGHSQGGYVIPWINSSTDIFKGYISMAGLANEFNETIKRQYLYLFNLDDKIDESEESAYNELVNKVEKLDSLDSKKYENEELPMDLPQKYWEFIINYDIQNYIKNINKPILVLNGDKDYQVVESDFLIWKENLTHNDNAEFIWYENLNHLFMFSDKEKSVPQDYYLEDNVHPKVIEDISNWIKSQN